MKLKRPAWTLCGQAALLTLSVACLMSGCVTKSQAREEARQAYIAGQRDGLLMAAQQKVNGPVVNFLGPLRNPVVNWVQGLTLSEAILSADYTGSSNPSSILIRRNGTVIPIDVSQLLEGQETLLQAGDVVEIRP